MSWIKKKTKKKTKTKNNWHQLSGCQPSNLWITSFSYVLVDWNRENKLPFCEKKKKVKNDMPYIWFCKIEKRGN